MEHQPVRDKPAQPPPTPDPEPSRPTESGRESRAPATTEQSQQATLLGILVHGLQQWRWNVRVVVVVLARGAAAWLGVAAAFPTVAWMQTPRELGSGKGGVVGL